MSAAELFSAQEMSNGMWAVWVNNVYAQIAPITGLTEGEAKRRADVLNRAAAGLPDKAVVELQTKLDAAVSFSRTDLRHALLAKVQPTTLEAYLAAHGWERCPVGGTSREWALDPHYVRVPLHPDFRDYAARVSDAIDGICGAERRAPFEVYLDVVGAR